MSKLLELAERCEKADEADQIIIIQAAFAAMHPKPEADYQPRRVPMFAPEFDAWAKLRARVLNCLCWNCGLEAAIALVPEGWTWVLFATGGAVLDRVIPSDGENKIRILSCATPALALCAAALRALASQEDQSLTVVE
ncbi:hypothetical protein [Sphingomonas sp.]|uniref:hypothetical protein n=1 Tax=Sphingomonas sp. TaxID=28214 RepID=UPI0031D65682